MKTILSIISFFIVVSTPAQYKFTIKAKTPALFNNKMIFLIIKDNYSSKRYQLIDSAIVKDGEFSFSGEIPKPSEWATVYLKKSNSFFVFAIDSGLSEIKVQTISRNSPTYKNSLSNTIVLNSQSNKLQGQIDSLDIKFIQVYGKPSSHNKYILELETKKRKELKLKKLQIIRQYPSTFYSLILLYQLSLERFININEIAKTFESLQEDLKTSPLGVELNKKIQLITALQIGKEIPTFSGKTETDSIFSSQYLVGRPFLLAFSATWCIPCKKNYPILKRLYEKYKNKGFEIVLLNLDDNATEWKKQIIEYKLNWVNVSELKKWNESYLVKLFNVLFIPFYIIVDKQGKIIYHSIELEDDELKKLENYIIKSIA